MENTKELKENDEPIEETIEESKLYLSEFKIVLINSDYSSGFKVKREKLYEILFNENIYMYHMNLIFILE